MSQFSDYQYGLTDWHWVLSVIINSQQWLIPLIVQACSLQYKGYLAFLSTYMYFNLKKKLSFVSFRHQTLDEKLSNF